MEKIFTLSNSILKITVLLLIFLCGNRVCAQTTYYDNYAFRIPLTLNNTSLNITTDQTNFVALVKVTSPSLVSGVCSDQTGGLSSSVPEFAIIDSAYSTTTELNYQVENYNATTGVIYFWVKLPVLYNSTSANGQNKLYCYFGSTSPSISHTTAWQKLTWSSVTATAGINYSGVWHFNESPAGTAPQFSDATVNNNNLSATTSGTISQNTSSQIGNGITLAATSVLDVGATNLPRSQDSQTLSIWASYPSFPSSHAANLIVLENGANPGNSGNGTQLGIISGPKTQTWRWANLSTPLVISNSAPAVNTWHYFVYTYDAPNKKSYLYIDGALAAGPTSNNSNPPISGATNMVAFGDYISNSGGTHAAGGESYTGTMDESHVIGATLTADWIKAEYVDQSSPDAFTSTGAMQTDPVRASAVAGYLVYTWKGVNTDITDPNNWDNTTTGTLNEAPVNSNVNWVIPAGKVNYPVLTTSTGVYGLTIASGASINLNGYTLGVGCNIYNSNGGQILYGGNNASKITWDGTISSQYYYGTNTPLTAQVGAMEVNNSSAGTVNISGGPLDVFNLLTITNGNLAIGSSPAALTLKSSSTLTASVTAIPASSLITGNVNVERYISGGSNTYRGYRFLSSPVYTASSGSNYYYDLSYLPLYAPITGSLGTAGGLTQGGNPSMYLYRDNIAFTNMTFNTGNFRGINKINNTPLYQIGVDYDPGPYYLHVGTGFLFFYRGDLTNLSTKFTTTTSAEANVFVSTGVLNQQAVTVTNWYTGSTNLQYSVVPGNTGYEGFNLVGNPYASSIDWNTFSTSSPTAGIYGPNVGTSTYIYNEASKVYAIYNSGIGTNGASNIIPSGQGFFVKATATGAQLIFNEAAKTNSQLSGPTQSTGTTLLLNATVTNNTVQYLRLNMAADSINKEEMVIRFESSAKNNFLENEDSGHLPGMGKISFSSMSADNVQTAINTIPLPKKSVTVKLNVLADANGLYSLNMTEIKNVPPLFDIWLMDAYKKDSLDMRRYSTYQFNIVSDTNSYGSNRFKLIIRQNPALGVRLLNFTAVKTTNGAQIAWKTANEEDYTNFTVERSTDNGVNFNALGTFRSSSTGTYNFIDTDPLLITDQYRLKLVDLNGTITYSNIVTLINGNSGNKLTNNGIDIYPNPAKNTLNLTIIPPLDSSLGRGLNLSSVTAATTVNKAAVTDSGTGYIIKIINNTGSVVKTATTSQPNWQTDVSDLTPGTYFIQVIKSGNKSEVGKSAFVKL